MRAFFVTALAAATAAGALATPAVAADDLAVLVYSHTAEFRHDSIPAGIATIEELGEANGFEVEATEDPAAFTAENLARFGAVVFLNTTGEVMEGDAARAAFEDYLRGGGGWVGVHAAADTEYDWAFYAELLGGAYFLTHPLVNQPGTLDVEAHDHPAVAHLPARWSLPSEEYYSFTDNPRGRVRVLMTIDESSYLQVPNTAILGPTPFAGGEASPLETGIMGDHPMSWCRDVDAGRSWYTAIGHDTALYERDDYREHLLQGILTAAGRVPADCGVDGSVDAGHGAPPAPPAPDDGAPDDGAPDDRPVVVEAPVPDADDGARPDVSGGTGAGRGDAVAGGRGSLPVTGTGWLPIVGLACVTTSALLRRAHRSR